MLELKGKYNTAKVFTNNVEDSAVGQIISLCNQEFASDSIIRIMPDTHAGAGCTIGTTMTLVDKVVPNLVGVDIGCGVRVTKLKETRIDLPKLDSMIRKCIPSGFDIREKEHKYVSEIHIDELLCKDKVNLSKAYLSLGSLGGGNHFIELSKSETDGSLFLLVHTGSRHLGLQVCKHYQDVAFASHSTNNYQEEANKLINEFKAQGKEKQIASELKRLKEITNNQTIDYNFAYCEGKLYYDYIHDMKITQEYAMWNRKAITDTILKEMKLHEVESFDTIHNYIEIPTVCLDSLNHPPVCILRKGAVSAKKGEKLIIPINMRDGSLICIGKGNEDWNYSAPHGAGRLMSRNEARNHITLNEFKKSMEGVFTTSVNHKTIDESPMAYKPIDEIVANIKDTVEIVEQIKPIYNFKAGEE